MSQRILKTLFLALQAMERQASHIRSFAPSAERVRLLLTDKTGAHWSVTMSPGSERFIGYYPRIEAFAAQSALLQYQSG